MGHVSPDYAADIPLPASPILASTQPENVAASHENNFSSSSNAREQFDRSHITEPAAFNNVTLKVSEKIKSSALEPECRKDSAHHLNTLLPATSSESPIKSPDDYFSCASSRRSTTSTKTLFNEALEVLPATEADN